MKCIYISQNVQLYIYTLQCSVDGYFSQDNKMKKIYVQPP